MIALPVIFLSFLYALNKSKSITPIFIIMGLTILFGIVNGAEGRYGVPPAAFAYLFDGNQYVRTIGSLLLSIIYISRFGFKIPNKGVFGLLLIYPFLMFIYFVGSSEQGFSDGIFGTIIKISDVIGFYLLIQMLSIDKNTQYLVLKFIAILGVIFIIINLLAIVLDPVNSYRAFRFRGIVFSVNWIGAYLTLILIPLFSQYFLSNDNKKYWLIFIVIDLVLIILTGSRASLIAAFVYIFSFIVLSQKQNDILINFRKVLFLLISFSLLLILIMNLYPEWFSFVNDRLSSNIDTRSDVFMKYFEMWYEKGYFLGLFSESYAVESNYVSALYVYGLVGLIIFLCIWIAILFKTYNVIRNREEVSIFNISGISMFLGYLVHSFFEAFYFGTMSAFNLFMYLGLALAFSKDMRDINYKGINEK